MATRTKDKDSRAPHSPWSELTCDDLAEWADPGSLERGQGYFENGNVESIALTKSGELLAWVEGTERYAVQVALAPRGESPKLASLCTCPVGYACKHAVAAVLTLMNAINTGKPVSLVRPNDPRLHVFDDEDDDDTDSAWDEELSEDWDDEPEERVPPRRAQRKNSGRLRSPVEDLRDLLGTKSQPELVELVLQLTETILNTRNSVDSALIEFSAACLPRPSKRPTRRPAAARRRQRAG